MLSAAWMMLARPLRTAPDFTTAMSTVAKVTAASVPTEYAPLEGSPQS